MCLSLSLSLSVSLSFVLARLSILIILIKCLKGHKSLGSLSERFPESYSYLSLSLTLSLSLSSSFFGQVMFLHHSDQMSQMSQGSRVTL